MSSTANADGFRVASHRSGQSRARAYVIDVSSYTTAIFKGDIVKLTDEGTIQLGTSDGSRTGTTDGVLVLGVFAGCEYVDTLGKPTVSPYWPGSGNDTNYPVTAYVYDDPEEIFEVQYDNPSAGTTVQTAVGEDCDWTGFAAPGGSTMTGQSTGKLSAIVATSGQLQIIGFNMYPADALTDAYVRALVRINEHHYKAAVNSI